MEEIFKSWGIDYNPNDTRNELASKRIEVCNSCPNKKEVDGVKKCMFTMWMYVEIKSIYSRNGTMP